MIVEIHEQPTEDELKRAENFQLAITTVVLSTYVSVSTSDSQIVVGGSDTLFPISIVAFIFLVGKLGVTIVRPYYDRLWIRRVDFVILPFFFAVSFLIGSSVFLVSLISLPDITPLVRLATEIRGLFRYKIFMGLYLLVVVVGSVWYAWRTGKTMSVIKSGVPEIQSTFTSGESESSLPLRIENPTSETISPEDLEIEVHWTEGVSVTVEGARKIDEHLWRPRVPINPEGGAMNVDLQFTRSDSGASISDEQVTVEVRLSNQVQQRHTIQLEG